MVDDGKINNLPPRSVVTQETNLGVLSLPHLAEGGHDAHKHLLLERYQLLESDRERGEGARTRRQSFGTYGSGVWTKRAEEKRGRRERGGDRESETRDGERRRVVALESATVCGCTGYG